MQRDLGYVVDILLACRDIREFTAGLSRDDLGDNKLVRLAVIRSIEVIGEATKRLSADFRASHPAIPWQSMAGMRDRLIHDYARIDLEVVWQVVDRDVPALLELLDPLAAPDESGLDQDR